MYGKGFHPEKSCDWKKRPHYNGFDLKNQIQGETFVIQPGKKSAVLSK